VEAKAKWKTIITEMTVTIWKTLGMVEGKIMGPTAWSMDQPAGSYANFKRVSVRLGNSASPAASSQKLEASN